MRPTNGQFLDNVCLLQAYRNANSLQDDIVKFFQNFRCIGPKIFSKIDYQGDDQSAELRLYWDERIGGTSDVVHADDLTYVGYRMRSLGLNLIIEAKVVRQLMFSTEDFEGNLRKELKPGCIGGVDITDGFYRLCDFALEVRRMAQIAKIRARNINQRSTVGHRGKTQNIPDLTLVPGGV